MVRSPGFVRPILEGCRVYRQVSAWFLSSVTQSGKVSEQQLDDLKIEFDEKIDYKLDQDPDEQ